MNINKIIFAFSITCLNSLLQCTAEVSHCSTPLGGNGIKLNIFECTPIISLIREYGVNLPRNEFIFVKRSFIKDSSGKILTVCCDNEMNITSVFKSIGTEILRNQAELCGDNIFKRVSFGEETTFMSYPWTALLVYDSPQQFHCGGTLITRQYVLTAAHCVTDHYYPLVGVRLREHNISAEIDCAVDDFGGQHCYQPFVQLRIERIIKHPGYDAQTYDHDIALLRLERAVVYERSLRPICLPEYQNQEFDIPNGIITGWGATENGKHSDVLLAATVPIQPSNFCRNLERSHRIDNFKICTSSGDSSHACKGDSGGPLIIRLEGYASGRKFRYMQMGIISLGNQNCTAIANGTEFSTLHVKVSAYKDWIAASIEL